MLRQDDRDPMKTHDLITWAFAQPASGDFSWAAVLQSPVKVRKHFATIAAQMNRSARGAHNGNGTASQRQSAAARSSSAKGTTVDEDTPDYESLFS